MDDFHEDCGWFMFMIAGQRDSERRSLLEPSLEMKSNSSQRDIADCGGPRNFLHFQ
jgi:hypothetical protein